MGKGLGYQNTQYFQEIWQGNPNNFAVEEILIIY